MKKLAVSVVGGAIVLSFLALSIVEMTAGAEIGGFNKCPYVATADGARMDIVKIYFSDEIQGMRLPAERRAQFRIALVTVRVRKPVGKKLSLACADLTLHYYHGAETEVAPCEGMSNFNRTEDEERAVTYPRMSGPGWVKQTSGPRATEASEVYFDCVFNMVEPDIRETWLCVGQPTTVQPFVSGGWKAE